MTDMNEQRHVIQIDVAEGEQAVLLTIGRGREVVLLSDEFTGPIDFPPVQRAVWVARLRTMADMIERSGS